MNVQLDIIGNDHKDFSSNFFQKTAQETLEAVTPQIRATTVLIDVGIVDEETIAVYNKKWLGKDRSTDVLSFPSNDSAEGLYKEGEVYHLGDILLCMPVIEAYAEKDGVSRAHALAYIFSHGILHLCGYEHGKKMYAIQDKVSAIYQG
jgi:probable rRNA maturation factor